MICQAQFTQPMVRYRIQQFNICGARRQLAERSRLESNCGAGGCRVRALVTRGAERGDELGLVEGETFVKLDHEVEPGWSRGRKGEREGLFPTGAVVMYGQQVEERPASLELPAGESDATPTFPGAAPDPAPTAPRPRIRLHRTELTVAKQGQLRYKDCSDRLHLLWKVHRMVKLKYLVAAVLLQTGHVVLAANFLLCFRSQKAFMEPARHGQQVFCTNVVLDCSTVAPGAAWADTGPDRGGAEVGGQQAGAVHGGERGGRGVGVPCHQLRGPALVRPGRDRHTATGLSRGQYLSFTNSNVLILYLNVAAVNNIGISNNRFYQDARTSRCCLIQLMHQVLQVNSR